ncbi:membrane protein insertion efficiency factor YidD [Tuwongella immobilis]|uniref:Putative membrane protein insertion efficiency factor n=1 Tax=Tuwongella immobilis TaxID=692036 RepID=A0A6C2YN93_9BACT|nr:membrane protein insertion efficiency factor YidD [Tuwongella immobilis]VIP02593.1 membrane protein : Putative membrane protein insertion efficiency factor OS=Planctomyces limnophilus (strain ATCC 43296 / DSM 3776 / IFAM 1008 / 290) GN=Plim_1541 PE=3 SV=1: Haemolytic [Tuwongella immobilis]VTS01867.1 membrane protein : Putative membrane protein insertion efficiency factor OS=Planctomyces limnophilus (strain ATCC 43296 / DSM 3776 / IFAM 1008 / 290) GN=Plim_1541 PE=3 SV=1: Haemolytic [Tuwongella 
MKRLLVWGLTRILIGLVRFYQYCIRPILPPMCRFMPSCSEYMILAIQKYGPIIGTWKGCRRLCRCHPWHPGGFDPP